MIENHWCITKDTKVKPAWWWEGDRRYRGDTEERLAITPQPVVSETYRPQEIVSLKAEMAYLRNKVNEKRDKPKGKSAF